ncbi:mRNA surveillance protein pelota [Staphylothermus hellenicus]|uniref:Protein pelota homolog n=1 Tax=Staphylothermus hellenicus (strain DSM 12710 / JCM 10830 / BK20S6-10-b1 / P8) TaxID=591019 RepID=D7DA73_STAHD|nr:mRNA surveillance protein pelota [Staphylothermus hellenicus]ADI32669.1 translation factor pelota [Staphylothermus hellenicus DSM 12710]
MKVLEKDLKKGYLKILPEDQDDLWALYNIIKPLDRVTATTTRDVKHGEISSSRRIPMTLTIEVRTLEFQPFTERLRIRGVVVEGPERYGVKGHYHTLNIDPGKPLVIWKEKWGRNELEIISRFTSRKQKVLLAAFDYDEAAIAMLTEQGIRLLEDFASNIPGKREPALFQKGLEKYLSSIAEKIFNYINKFQVDIVVIASPGDLQRRVARIIKEKKQVNIITDTVSIGGQGGIRELLRRDSVREAIKEINIIKAQRILDEFHKYLSKNPDMVAYGIDDVEYAVKHNAVDKLLVSEELLRVYDEEARRRVSSILDEAYRRRAEIIIVPHNSDVGLEVEGLGGIVALLRYPLKKPLNN